MKDFTKRLLSLSAALIMTFGFAGCGSNDEDDDDDKGGKSSSPKAGGTYLAFDVTVQDNSVKTESTADELLEEAKNRYKQLKADEDSRAKDSSKGIGCIVELDDGSFKAYCGNGLDLQEFSGAYSQNGNKLSFDYDKLVSTFYGRYGNAPDLYFDEPIVNVYKPGDSTEGNTGEMLKAIDDAGAFWTEIGPFNYYAIFNGNPMAYTASSLPPATGRIVNTLANWALTRAEYRKLQQLYSAGDFLCGDAPCFELDGSYKTGKKFTIVFDPMAMIEDSVYDTEKAKDQAIEQLKSPGPKLGYGSTDKMKIDFEDGKWTWYNANGEEYSHGEYSESSDYKGFIKILPDQSNESFKSMGYIEYIYIDGGEIYYPFAVKID